MQLDPYLHFGGTCEEALTFYASVFGGKIVSLNRYEGSPMLEHAPPGWEKKILHASFEAPGVRFMAADSSHSRSAAGHVSLSLSTNDAGEGKRIFEMLSAGGTVTMPYQATFWGADFGMLTDRFGVDWMVNSDNASA